MAVEPWVFELVERYHLREDDVLVLYGDKPEIVRDAFNKMAKAETNMAGGFVLGLMTTVLLGSVFLAAAAIPGAATAGYIAYQRRQIKQAGEDLKRALDS